MAMHDSRNANLFIGMVRAACLATLASIIALAGTVSHAQVTAQTLIGKAVSDDTQTQEVTGAINRFRDRDIDGCRAILERVKSNNVKIWPDSWPRTGPTRFRV